MVSPRFSSTNIYGVGQSSSPEFALAARPAAVSGGGALRRRHGGGRAAGGALREAAAVAAVAGARVPQWVGGMGWG